MTLQTMLDDALFPPVDLGLRAGRHIDQDDFAAYAFLCESQAVLEAFYRRYGWDLVRSAEGYFYLRPMSAKLRRRRLTIAEMLVGQSLAYLLLDPATVEASGLVTRTQVFEILVNLVGEERLRKALLRRRERRDQRIEDELVRQEFASALRTLKALGFIDVVNDRLRLRIPLMRFAEVARGLADPQEALGRLIAAGDAALPDEEDET